MSVILAKTNPVHCVIKHCSELRILGIVLTVGDKFLFLHSIDLTYLCCTMLIVSFFLYSAHTEL